MNVKVRADKHAVALKHSEHVLRVCIQIFERLFKGIAAAFKAFYKMQFHQARKSFGNSLGGNRAARFPAPL